MLAARGIVGQHNGQRLQFSAITLGNGAPTHVVFIQSLQFDGKNRGLYLIQTRVEPTISLATAAASCTLAQHADTLRKCRVMRDNQHRRRRMHRGFRIETEGPHSTPTSRAPPRHLCRHAPAHNPRPHAHRTAPPNSQNRRQAAQRSKQMDGQHRLDAGTVRAQIVLQSLRRQRPIEGIDIDKTQASMRSIAATVATAVLATVTTLSPCTTPSARSASSTASVPFATPTACATPQ